MTRWIPSPAILLLCACISSTARTAVLRTDLEPRVGADYQPVGSDEVAIWQSLDRLEAVIRNSPQRVNSPAVKSGSPWKRVAAIKNLLRWEDVWTFNGPQIDRITLVSGLPEGKAIVSQKTKADQQVPVFRADMTTQDLVSMVEVSYRVNGVTVFNMESVEPFDFLGGRGIRLRYNYVSGIAFGKRGSCVMRIVDGKLYAMKLESLAGRSFDTVAPEFDRLIASAELDK